MKSTKINEIHSCTDGRNKKFGPEINHDRIRDLVKCSPKCNSNCIAVSQSRCTLKRFLYSVSMSLYHCGGLSVAAHDLMLEVSNIIFGPM